MKINVLPPQLIAMDDCFFQGQSSLHPNDVSEAINLRHIHNNVPLDLVESVIMFSAIQLLVKCEILCVITPIDGN
jgi:hypothetical protein